MHAFVKGAQLRLCCLIQPFPLKPNWKLPYRGFKKKKKRRANITKALSTITALHITLYITLKPPDPLPPPFKRSIIPPATVTSSKSISNPQHPHWSNRMDQSHWSLQISNQYLSISPSTHNVSGWGRCVQLDSKMTAVHGSRQCHEEDSKGFKLKSSICGTCIVSGAEHRKNTTQPFNAIRFTGQSDIMSSIH